jgi:hypothetical protein
VIATETGHLLLYLGGTVAKGRKIYINIEVTIKINSCCEIGTVSEAGPDFRNAVYDVNHFLYH